MKTTFFIKIILLLAFLSATLFCYSQQIEKCGPYKIDKEALAKALDYEKYHQNAKQSSTRVVLRVFFQICEPNQGVGGNVTEAMMQTEIDHLVNAYGANNICFLNGGYNYIYNNALDNFNFSTDNPALFNPYKIQNCITIFFIDNLSGTNGSSGGGASGVTFGPLPTNWTIVTKAYINKGTTEHEVGHCLGLMHTFDFTSGFGLEDIDESNGSTSADKIPDTYADPYVFNYEDKESCFSSSDCLYNGTCADPKGNKNYTPPYTNLMSYWCQGFYPTYTLTIGQYVRINSFLSTSSILQNCESPYSVLENPNTYSSGYHINSAITNLNTSGNVVFNNTVIATLGAGDLVALEPGFQASPSTVGKILILIAECSTSPHTNFSSSNSGIYQNNISNNFKNNNTAFTVYPNPTSSIVNLNFTTSKNENNVVVQVFNAEMKQVKETNIGDLIKGKQSTVINLNDLASGMYFIIVQLQYEKLVTKVSVIK